MSKYTTGEIAKLCGVTVRTVQYYDSRNILTPSALSEGGRRLYSEDDLRLMKIICFLRETGLPINSISALLAEEKPEKPEGCALIGIEDFMNVELRSAQIIACEKVPKAKKLLKLLELKLKPHSEELHIKKQWKNMAQTNQIHVLA